MARALNDEELKLAELIHAHDLHNKLEKKHSLLVEAVEQVHKPTKLHKLFNKNCRLCKVMKAIK
jgi:hypothetical protein